MAKFYQTEIQTMADDTVAVGATVTFEDSVDAQIGYFSKCASNLTAIKNGTLKACIIKTIGETGTDISSMSTYLNNIEPTESMPSQA